MTQITAALVAELRAATGISLLKCKKALEDAAGDLEKARDILRKQGESDAAKKADRATAEGAVVVKLSDDGKKAALVQVFCETDFVARGDDFTKLTSDVVALAFEKGAVTAKTESEALTQAAIQKIGENVRVGEIAVEETTGAIGSYIHSNKKIGVLVVLSAGSVEVARDVAMHVAAMNPGYLNPEDVAEVDVAKEKEIQVELLKKENKPEAMVEKILEGKLRKFREASALVKQPFVKDASKTVEQYLKDAGATITKFVRLAI